MKITFGLALDGLRPSTPVFNHCYCGLKGLIEALELRLGLAHETTGSATRLHQYLIALEATASRTQCFFSESLKVDRWGAAASLLTMRDELKMAGWNGEMIACARLHDFGEVEKIANGQISAGLAERIESICAALAMGKSGIAEIQCVDRLEFLPYRLRCLLELLDAKFLPCAGSELATKGTNLRLLQDYLTGSDFPEIGWNQNDNSVIFATAYSEITLAHAAAQLLQSEDHPTLLATVPAQPVADVLLGCQVATPALDVPSPLRPIGQVLGLALEMRWSPPDPSILLQFLSHPVSPIHRELRTKLADAVADQPGIGSKSWNEAIEKARETVKGKKTLRSDEIASELSRIESDLEQWILIERFPREGGASGKALAETAKRVESWARKRAAVDSDESKARHFSILATHAGEFSSIAEELTTIQPEELSHILEQVCITAPPAGDRIAQLGSCQYLADAGAALEPTDFILWWGFENQVARFSMRWSALECRKLRAVGVHLPKAEDHLVLSNDIAKRPFLAACKRIVLFWPKSRGGEPVERHSLYSVLEARFGSLAIHDLDRDDLPLAKTERSVRHLPSKKRWIKLSNPTHLTSRNLESYSSLSKFAIRPFEWVFNYKAELRRGALREINVFIQRGNLLHRVVERLMEPSCELDWKSADKNGFSRWLDDTWPGLLETEGSNFLMPGSQTDGLRLQEDARRAIWSLVCHMNKANAVAATADVHMPHVPMANAPSPLLGGNIDLLVTNSNGKTAVVDLKFGQAKAKRKELETNTPLQLVTYAKLIAATAQEWPHVAYYILQSGRLLAQDKGFFPDAELVRCREESSNPEEIWNAFLAVWHWRRAQLDAGWVEIPVEGATPTDGTGSEPCSTPPGEEWTSDPAARRYDDFQFLTGWEVQ